MTLFEEVANFWSLRRAAERAARGHRARPEVARFLSDIDREVLALERELQGGTWMPGRLFTFHIRDPKPRTIAAAPFRDCVVHHALCAAIEPALEARADPDSYACRRGKGNHAAVRQVQALSRLSPWYLKVDVRHYFEAIPHQGVLDTLRATLADDSTLPLVEAILTAGAGSPGLGLPIGTLTSQHFANLYLGHLDVYARQTLGVGGWVRYMDDMVAFGTDRETVRRWVGALGEALQPQQQPGASPRELTTSATGRPVGRRSRSPPQRQGPDHSPPRPRGFGRRRPGPLPSAGRGPHRCSTGQRRRGARGVRLRARAR